MNTTQGPAPLFPLPDCPLETERAQSVSYDLKAWTELSRQLTHPVKQLSGQPHTGQPHSAQPRSAQPRSAQPHSAQPHTTPAARTTIWAEGGWRSPDVRAWRDKPARRTRKGQSSADLTALELSGPERGEVWLVYWIDTPVGAARSRDEAFRVAARHGGARHWRSARPLNRRGRCATLLRGVNYTAQSAAGTYSVLRRQL